MPNTQKNSFSSTEEIITEILKEKLRIEVEAYTEDYYSRRKDTVKVKIFFNDALISESSDRI
jgi:hypothetical protein